MWSAWAYMIYAKHHVWPDFMKVRQGAIASWAILIGKKREGLFFFYHISIKVILKKKYVNINFWLLPISTFNFLQLKHILQSHELYSSSSYLCILCSKKQRTLEIWCSIYVLRRLILLRVYGINSHFFGIKHQSDEIWGKYGSAPGIYFVSSLFNAL